MAANGVNVALTGNPLEGESGLRARREQAFVPTIEQYYLAKRHDVAWVIFKCNFNRRPLAGFLGDVQHLTS